MGTKFTTQSISGYNANPPPDDGTTGDDNKVTWAKHKDKLTDPIKTLTEAINTALVDHFDDIPIAKSGTYTTVADDHNRIIECTSSPTITLLAAATGGAGYTVGVKNAGTGTVTVASSDGVDGSTADRKLEPGVCEVYCVDASATDYILKSEHGRRVGKNYIINGAFDIWQRGTSFTDVGGGTYTADRWEFRGTRSGSNTVDADRETVDVPTTGAEAIKFTFNGGAAAVAGTNVSVNQKVEGYTVRELGFGAAGAKSVTLSFWFKASVTGTYCVTLTNDGENRTNIQEFSVADTNWNDYSVTFAGDTTGTWNVYASTGVNVGFTFTAGSTFQGSAGWNAGQYYGTASQTDIGDTIGATALISKVKLEVGSTATDFSTAGANIAEELAMCQRYYEVIEVAGGSAGPMVVSVDTNTAHGYLQYSVKKRSDPVASASTADGTWTLSGVAGESFSSFGFDGEGTTGCRIRWEDSGTPFSGAGEAGSISWTAAGDRGYFYIDAEL